MGFVIAGIILIGVSLSYPALLQRLRGYDWTGHLRTPGLRRLGRLQDRAIQAIIGSIGAALLVGGGGILAGLPGLLVLVLASIFLGITMAATLSLVAILIRIRRVPTSDRE